MAANERFREQAALWHFEEDGRPARTIRVQFEGAVDRAGAAWSGANDRPGPRWKGGKELSGESLTLPRPFGRGR
jgi:hypothetical protein